MRPPDGRYLIMVLLCLTAAAARIIVGPHITDDAYITMRYSRNLSADGAMSYNPPDAVLGTSTPLWTWILASGDAAGVAPETTAVIVASAADLCSIALILTSAVGGTLAATVAAATVAAWPAYVTYAVSGMETSLYVLTVVGFMVSVSRQWPVMAAVAASLGFLCRPDGALLVLLGFAWMVVSRSRSMAVRFAATAALICVPWTVYAFVRFGSIVPASVSAKASGADPWLLSLENLQAYFLQGVYVPITILAIAGFVAIARSGEPFWRIWSVWAWSYAAAMTAANAFTHFPWYFVPLLPIYTGAAAVAIEKALSHEIRLRAVLRTTGARAAIASVLAIVLLSRMSSLKTYLDSTAAGREDLYASVATELAGVDGNCTVAATEIGTIGYHYPGRVLDLVGLVSPEVIGRPVGAVLAESQARWLVTYDTHFDRAVASSEPFSRMFERRTAVRVSDTRTLEVYERRDGSGCVAP
jgi:arabinofuranosyltransferase